MTYEETFTDYEKMLKEGALQGFLYKKFQTIYEYLYKKVGVDSANTWMLQDKQTKQIYCAKLILHYKENYSDVILTKVTKFLSKYDK
jgi:hypothetical protein